MGRLLNNQIQQFFREANRYAAALARSGREQLEIFYCPPDDAVQLIALDDSDIHYAPSVSHKKHQYLT